MSTESESKVVNQPGFRPARVSLEVFRIQAALENTQSFCTVAGADPSVFLEQIQQGIPIKVAALPDILYNDRMGLAPEPDKRGPITDEVPTIEARLTTKSLSKAFEGMSTEQNLSQDALAEDKSLEAALQRIEEVSSALGYEPRLVFARKADAVAPAQSSKKRSAAKPSGPPKRASERDDFIEFAKANQWKTRRERGFEWRMDVFEFVQQTYGEWIGKLSETDTPLTQADIKAVDLSLWQKFQQEASKRGAPEELQLPSIKDARLTAIDDEHVRVATEQIRELERKRSKLRRQMKKISS